MTCPRCEGLLVVEPLPPAVEMIIDYSPRFGWLRCLCCGWACDLTMFRNRAWQKAKELVAA